MSKVDGQQGAYRPSPGRVPQAQTADSERQGPGRDHLHFYVLPQPIASRARK